MGLGSKTTIFQFVPSLRRLSGFFQIVEVPKYFLTERQHPFYEEQKRKPCDLF